MDKGLKKGAIGYLSNIVIGVASTAPAYSLAATLGFIVAVKGVGVHAPAVMLVAFIPMLLVAAAYKYFNRADPDAGTTFAWVTRAFGPTTGWLNGWAIFLADLIVMASLADIAAVYTFKLFGFTELGESKAAIIIGAVLWIALMTWICYRGIELSARIQQMLLGAEIFILGLFSVVAFVKVYGSHPPSGLDQAVAVVAQPLRDELRRPGRRAPARGVHLLGLGFRRRGQRGVRGSGRGPGQGRGRLDDPARADLRARHSGLTVLPRHRLPDQQRKPGRCAERARYGRAGERPGQAADHRGAHLGVGLDADDDPADRPHDAVDGALESGHQPACRVSTGAT